MKVTKDYIKKLVLELNELLNSDSKAAGELLIPGKSLMISMKSSQN
jgi:hypothetical protein